MKLLGVSLRLFLVSTFLMMLPSIAWCALVDNAASVLADQARMKGALSSVDKGAYVLHEITMPSGAKVREYVSPAGAVFAVAWDGQFPPDFQQLLGPYYQQANQAGTQQASSQQSGEQQPHRRRGPVVIETPNLVFSQTGHARNFHGQAYIPQLVPQGVTADDIR